jgi:hypothetical protein
VFSVSTLGQRMYATLPSVLDICFKLVFAY